MKIYRHYFFICFVIISLMSACKEKKATAENTLGEENSTSSINDTIQIKETILSFYNWYVPNWERLSQFKLYQGEVPPYKMDWDQVNKLHAYIRSSVPQLGEEFITNQVYFLKQTDSAFKS